MQTGTAVAQGKAHGTNQRGNTRVSFLLQDRKIVAARLTQPLMTTCTNKLFVTQHGVTTIHKGIEESQMSRRASTPRGRQ